MKKRLLSMLMAVLMIVSLVPAVSADAGCTHDVKADCVKNLSVKLDAAAKQPGIELYYCTEDDCVLPGATITPFAEAKDYCTKHTFKTVELQKASCVDLGVSVSYCSVCGVAASEPVTLTKADDMHHVYTKFVVSVAPTCEHDGYGYALCDVCGEPVFVGGPDAAVKLLGDKATTAAKDAAEKLFKATNLSHTNKDGLVAATENTYTYEWKLHSKNEVGVLVKVPEYKAAVEAVHALTVNGEADVIGAVPVSADPTAYAKMNVTKDYAYATPDKGWGRTADKYCPDCGEIVVASEAVKGLNNQSQHEMTLVQAGYYPYFDAANGVKHDGVSDVWYCKTCGANVGGEVLPYADFFQYVLDGEGLPTNGCVVGDTWVVDAKAPSCTVKGSTGTTYTLTKDKGWQVSVDAEEIPALGHDLVKVESKEATCQEYGWTCESYYICNECDYTQGIAVYVAEKPTCHNEASVLVSATCKNTGLVVYPCVWCGHLYNAANDSTNTGAKVDTIKLAPCTAGEVVNAKEATCTEAGYTGDTFCKWCNKPMTTGKEIPMVDHTAVDVEAVAATCTEAGTTAGTKCSVCDKVLSGCEAVDALGHTFDKGVCTVCGAEDPDYVAPVAPEFTDAKDIAPYAGDAVAWAVANGIVNGRDDGSFDPKANVTRAEVVTMLYRLAGEPEVDVADVEFVDAEDVPDFATKAVAWAAMNGVVEGYEDGTFKPMANITRAEFVQMLYKMGGSVKAEAVADFSDVVAGEWYVDAINWAVENEVTTGRDNGTFGVADNATREEAVTFLYRAFAE